MGSPGDCLGICFAGRQLFYAVNHPDNPSNLQHIGSIDYSFPLVEVLSDADSNEFLGLATSINNLAEQYSCKTLRMLSPTRYECWSTFPRLVQETPDEREDHLAILMDDVPRHQLETTWHELSNRDYKLMMVRNRALTQNYQALAKGFSESDFVSEFELGSEWHLHTGMKGSYLTIHAHNGKIVLASYLLGTLRGATWIRCDDLNDLPYLWSYHARHLPWMNGFHEQAYLFGESGLEVADVLSTFFNDSGTIQLMNNLSDMQVEADEETYGFRLESAFPAVLLSLNVHSNKAELQS